MRGFLCVLVAGVLLAGPAFAASPMGQLKGIDGKVYVNRGKGFVQARDNTELFQGDRVMVGENGSASINYYLAECDVMLTASSMTTVAAEAPCKDGSTTSTQGLTFSESTLGPLVVGAGVLTMGVLGFEAGSSNSNRDQNQDDDEGQSP